MKLFSDVCLVRDNSFLILTFVKMSDLPILEIVNEERKVVLFIILKSVKIDVRFVNSYFRHIT